MSLYLSWCKQPRLKIVRVHGDVREYARVTTAHLATNDGRTLCGRQLDASKLAVSAEYPRCGSCEEQARTSHAVVVP